MTITKHILPKYNNIPVQDYSSLVFERLDSPLPLAFKRPTPSLNQPKATQTKTNVFPLLSFPNVFFMLAYFIATHACFRHVPCFLLSFLNLTLILSMFSCFLNCPCMPTVLSIPFSCGQTKSLALTQNFNADYSQNMPSQNHKFSLF